ncbi:cereblon family protein [Desulfoluna spongiiphila]|uniref:cereblon family protein n=1 Tax=Desulfoluna spongiiphila TaxID=419481 RepID=UPI001255A96F|nr:cereblon family protein [Desulfoluna spongiiphila]VVS91217.1 cult domain [Desulfoluna spongiiphila]
MMSTHSSEHTGTLSLVMSCPTDTGCFVPVEARDCPIKKGGCTGKSGAPARKKGLATEAVDHSGGGVVIVCATCGFPITRDNDRMEVGGSHTHGFANPHGLYYEIGCFAAAPGCAFSSDSSAEFSWFAGYRWRLAGCRGCGTHMGWLFESKTGSFVGLILAALTREEEGKGER